MKVEEKDGMNLDAQLHPEAAWITFLGTQFLLRFMKKTNLTACVRINWLLYKKHL